MLILLWLGVAFYLTLWPFDFIYHNSVTFPTEGGLHFKSPSIAYIHQLPRQLYELKKFSICTEVKPDESDADKGGVLFGFCYDHIQQNFLAMQNGKNLGFYLADKKNVNYIWMRGVFEKNQSVWITITYDGDKIITLKNGTIQNVTIAKNLDFSFWNKSFPFIFANTGTGTIPWSGTIYSFDIFDEVVTISNSRQRDSIRECVPPLLSLSFPSLQTESNIAQKDLTMASIVIPAMYNPPAKGLISSIRYLFGKWEWDFPDFFLNTLFFIPLGLFLRPLLEKLTRRDSISFWLTIITGLILTIVIETIQIVLPERDTSIMDVLSNTLGTIIGSLLFAIPLIRRTFNEKVNIK